MRLARHLVLLFGVLCASGAALPADPAATAAEIRPLLVGAEVPALTLTSADGTPFDLRQGTSGKPAILVFHRGGW